MRTTAAVAYLAFVPRVYISHSAIVEPMGMEPKRIDLSYMILGIEVDQGARKVDI